MIQLSLVISAPSHGFILIEGYFPFASLHNMIIWYLSLESVFQLPYEISAIST